MNPDLFLNLVRELVEDNPFAIRPFLKLARIRFTEAIATLAVTREAAPELWVNLVVLGAHCRTEAEVKAVILHEFLHVLLRHTEGRGPVAAAEHLAMDAVINALIHRQAGPKASAMMARYYAGARGLERLLRPPRPGELGTGAGRTGGACGQGAGLDVGRRRPGRAGPPGDHWRGGVVGGQPG